MNSKHDTTVDQADDAPEKDTLHAIAADYVDLDDEIKRLDALVKQQKAMKKDLEEQLIEAMMAEGAASVEIVRTGGKKARVSPVSKLYASRNTEVTPEGFVEAFHQADMGDLVKESVNSNTLAAWVREYAEQHGVRDSGAKAITEALPEGLRAVIKVSTAPALQIRRKS